MMCLTMAQAAETEQSSTDEKPTKVVKLPLQVLQLKGLRHKVLPRLPLLKAKISQMLALLQLKKH